MKKHCLGVAIVSLLLALAISGVQAQMMGGAGGGGAGMGGHHKRAQDSTKSKDQAPKADEKAYAAALKTVPNKPFDPWHGVR